MIINCTPQAITLVGNDRGVHTYSTPDPKKGYWWVFDPSGRLLRVATIETPATPIIGFFLVVPLRIMAAKARSGMISMVGSYTGCENLLSLGLSPVT